jgi:hypothetical protein
MPFDRFVVAQYAGDLLPNATDADRVATGFHRNTPINQEGGINVEQFRIDSVIDRTNTTGSVFLGLTVGCAQCHDHKFDPIAQREYYQLFAFLNNDDEPALDLLPADLQKRQREVSAALTACEAKLKAIDPVTPARLVEWERAVKSVHYAGVPQDVQTILQIAENGREDRQLEAIAAYFRQTDKVRNITMGLASPLSAAVQAHLLTTRSALETERIDLRGKLPTPKSTLVLHACQEPRETHLLIAGDFTRPGVVVAPGTPSVLPALPTSGNRDRLVLASWLVGTDNPLTPRVFVNRVWQHYFGLGIVETENDFGTQGTPPSHPELLDWLASEFVRGKWDVKALHKLIVGSATYRQTSKTRPDLSTMDPRNRLLARQSRLRLEAEIVRDVCLSASGLLTPEVGGPSVFPPQPDGIYRFTQVPRVWKPSTGPDRYRRGMYTHFWRSAPHPALTTFDAPEGTFACTRRNRSNTPLQALTLLNDEGFNEYAAALADRVRHDAAGDGDRIRTAFRLCLARPPSDREFQRLNDLLSRQRSSGSTEGAAWVMLARVLLNVDEFITRE